MIDILLPFFGDTDLMREAVQSVQAQSSPDWRLIVVDDANPGLEFSQWLESLPDHRIEYHRNDQTLGVNANFRRCLALASAPYVVFMGCDDVMHPHFIDVMSAGIGRHPGVGFVQPRVQVVDRTGAPARTLTDHVKRLLTPRLNGDRVLGGEALAISLLRGAWTYFPAICWQRALLETHPFHENFQTVLDLALMLDLVLDGAELLLLDEVAFAYRRHAESASSRTARTTHRFAEENALFADVAPRFEKRGWGRAARTARVHVTSRLHAATFLPRAMLERDAGVPQALARHAFGYHHAHSGALKP